MTSQDLYIAQAIGTPINETTIHFDYQETSSQDQISIFQGIQNPTNDGVYSFNSEGKCNIYQLGIQTLPGVKVKLGENSSDIRIGQTGIFEVNLSTLAPIVTKVSFPGLATYLSAKTKDENGNEINNNYIIIDVIYSINESGGKK